MMVLEQVWVIVIKNASQYHRGWERATALPSSKQQFVCEKSQNG